MTAAQSSMAPFQALCRRTSLRLSPSSHPVPRPQPQPAPQGLMLPPGASATLRCTIWAHMVYHSSCPTPHPCLSCKGPALLDKDHPTLLLHTDPPQASPPPAQLPRLEGTLAGVPPLSATLASDPALPDFHQGQRVVWEVRRLVHRLSVTFPGSQFPACPHHTHTHWVTSHQ